MRSSGQGYASPIQAVDLGQQNILIHANVSESLQGDAETAETTDRAFGTHVPRNVGPNGPSTWRPAAISSYLMQTNIKMQACRRKACAAVTTETGQLHGWLHAGHR